MGTVSCEASADGAFGAVGSHEDYVSVVGVLIAPFDDVLDELILSVHVVCVYAFICVTLLTESVRMCKGTEKYPLSPNILS